MSNEPKQEVKQWEILVSGKDLAQAVSDGCDLFWDSKGRSQRIEGIETRCLFNGTKDEVKLFCFHGCLALGDDGYEVEYYYRASEKFDAEFGIELVEV